jgi:hypothetical protein
MVATAKLPSKPFAICRCGRLDRRARRHHRRNCRRWLVAGGLHRRATLQSPFLRRNSPFWADACRQCPRLRLAFSRLPWFAGWSGQRAGGPCWRRVRPDPSINTSPSAPSRPTSCVHNCPMANTTNRSCCASRRASSPDPVNRVEHYSPRGRVNRQRWKAIDHQAK